MKILITVWHHCDPNKGYRMLYIGPGVDAYRCPKCGEQVSLTAEVPELSPESPV